jgi:hypothetical protein
VKRFIPILCGLALAAVLAAAPRVAAAAPAPPAGTHAKPESPFACDAAAFSPAVRKRHFEELGPKLRALRRSARELSDGYEFEFPPDPATYALLSEWMIQERSCCPFFDLSLRFDREGGPLWLRLTGRNGVKEFIKAEFPEAWFRRGTAR